MYLEGKGGAEMPTQDFRKKAKMLKWQFQDCSDPKGKPTLHFCLTLTNTAHQSSCKLAQRNKEKPKGTTVHDNMI